MDSKVKLVYVYGSRARGEAVTSSDTDVAMVVDDKSSMNMKDKLEIAAEVISLNKFAKPKVTIVDNSSSTVLMFEIVRDGQLIFVRDGVDRTSFEAGVMRRYYDMEKVRRIYRSYLYEDIKGRAYAN